MKAAPLPTRDRLLEAAARVFAREGLTGATTRAIAEEAGVNEVTLFRHFQTKERLLAAVVQENFGSKLVPNQVEIPTPTADLRADLLALTRCYETLLTSNWPLVRAMLGEMHHHLTESGEKQVFRAIFLPLKEAALHLIESAQKDGRLRADQRADVLSEILFGSIFTSVLRRSMPHLKIEYSAATYLETAVATFLHGAATRETR
ncbi:MAG: TetR/AcrR family transcriptional regulator [Lacunisphaera sp.]